MAVSDTLINTLFDGRYRIMRKLGAGGMANVYLAEDQELGRRVAIKILDDRHANDDQFVERFRREAKNAAGLSHPNIVSIYDRGEAEGTYYIAMEYLDGRSLKELIVSRGPAPVQIAMKHLSTRPVPPSEKRGEIPRDLDLIVLRALAKDPAERYQSAEEMDADLERVLRGAAVSPATEEAATAIISRPPPPPVQPTAITQARQSVPYAPPAAYYDYDEPRRRAIWPWLLALLFVAVAAVGGYFLYNEIQNQISGGTVGVEQYRGLREIDAVHKIRSIGLVPNVVRSPSADVPET